MSLFSSIFTPVQNVVKATSSVLNIFPDPSKGGTLYDGVAQVYDTTAQTLIAVPDTATNSIPVVSLAGDVLSSAVSGVLKDVGIVADHFIMQTAQIVDAADTLLVGGTNIAAELIKNPTNISAVINDNNPNDLDSVVDIAGHLASYAVNSLESHLFHDTELLASPFDLIIDITNDIKENTGICLPGAPLLNSLVDGTVVGIHETTGGLFDNIRQDLAGLGLPISDAGTMRHDVMDHVGEGNIREGYAAHDGHTHDGHTHEDGSTHDHGTTTPTEPTTSGLIGALFTPVKDVVGATSSILNIFPDPSKDGTLYDGLANFYDTAAQTLIAVPDTATNGIPGVSLAGDILSSAVSGVLKDVGIVGDHFIMQAAQIVDAADTLLVGGTNIVDEFIQNPTNISAIINDNNASDLDSVVDILGHLGSYAANSYESHLHHDADLLASPFDLIIDITNDIKENTGITVPGASLLNSIVDGTVVSVNNLSGTVFDGIRDGLSGLGLPVTDAGSVDHSVMDHVGEGNIREGYSTHDGHTHNDGSAHDHSTTTSILNLNSGLNVIGDLLETAEGLAQNISLDHLLNSTIQEFNLDSLLTLGDGGTAVSLDDLVCGILSTHDGHYHEIQPLIAAVDTTTSVPNATTVNTSLFNPLNELLANSAQSNLY